MWITTTAMLLAGHSPLATAYVAPTPEAAVAPATDELQERYDALMEEYSSATEAYREATSAAYKKHTDAGGGRRDFKRPPAIEGDFYPKFQAIADEGHAGADVWCLSNHSYCGLKGDAAKTDKLKRYRSILDAKPGDEVLGQLMRPVSSDSRASRGGEPLLNKKAAFAILDEIKAQAKDDDLGAGALMAKARIAKPYGATAEQAAEAALIYKQIVAEYPETSTASRCKGLIFAAENLQIGMKAPDIVGKDHDGNDIKLSDFKGKVTVIDFWGFW